MRRFLFFTSFLFLISIVFFDFTIREAKAWSWCDCIDGWHCSPDEGQQDCAWGNGARRTCRCCRGCPGEESCFTSETKISTPEGDPTSPEASEGQEKEIKDIEEGDVVKSFDPETEEIGESTVTNVHKRQVSGYYVLKTESGREIKVTGEHPILAVKADKSEAQDSKPETISNIKILNSKLAEFLGGVWEKVTGMVR